jgi:cytochrome c-type biogenesis protein CcmH/NrfG
VAQARQGRFAEAVRSYSEALRREPGFEAARRNMAAAQGMAGRR